MKLEVVQVPLPVIVINALLTIRRGLDKDLVSAIEAALECCSASPTEGSSQETAGVTEPPNGQHTAEFLGVPFATNTLPEVFEEFVNMTAVVAPEALCILSEVRTSGRHYVARKREEIHMNSSHLPVMQTSSGWWISKNISKLQLKAALRALCDAADLQFGEDVKFPLPPKAK